MSSGGGSALDVTINNLSSPWDLAAIFLGVAAAGATAMWGGWPLDNLLPIGAFGALALRKGLQAVFLKSCLSRRAKAIMKELAELPKPLQDSLQGAMSMEYRIWKGRASSNDDFAERLDEIITDLRKLQPTLDLSSAIATRENELAKLAKHHKDLEEEINRMGIAIKIHPGLREGIKHDPPLKPKG